MPQIGAVLWIRVEKRAAVSFHEQQ